MKINTLLKNATTVLFTDCEHFNKDITGVKSLADIKSWFSIVGTLRKTAIYSNKIDYKLVGSDYRLTLTII